MSERTIEELKIKLRDFAEVRDWNQFHSPKNLAMALSVEAGEIVEKFQWLTEEQSYEIGEDKLAEVKDEVGDVLIYLTRLADRLDIDMLESAFDKLETNQRKYPVEKSKGSAKKYTEL